MAVEKLSILKIDTGMIHVRPLVQSWCENCSANVGCGMGLLQKMRNMRSDNKGGLNIPVSKAGQGLLGAGDTVEVSLADSQLIKYSFLLYVLPLVSMLVATFAIQQITTVLNLAESWIILGALLALVCGFFLVHYFTNRLPGMPEDLFSSTNTSTKNSLPKT